MATKLGWLQSSKVVMYRQFIQSRDISSEVAWPVSLYHVQAREMSQGWATKLDLAFNNVKPKDWYFVLDLVRFRTGLSYE